MLFACGQNPVVQRLKSNGFRDFFLLHCMSSHFTIYEDGMKKTKGQLSRFWMRPFINCISFETYTFRDCSYLSNRQYHELPFISPGLIHRRKGFLEGLLTEGLISEGD